MRLCSCGGKPSICLNCEKHFLAKKSTIDSTKWTVFCSRKCYYESKRSEVDCVCPNCGKAFKAWPSLLDRSKHPPCCSIKCRKEYRHGVFAGGFKRGSLIHSQMRERHVLVKRAGYVSSYTGEHRIIAGALIGRPIRRGEYVLRIDRNPENNDGNNLFVCESTEFFKIRSGVLPWPSKSNLANYGGVESHASLRSPS